MFNNIFKNFYFLFIISYIPFLLFFNFVNQVDEKYNFFCLILAFFVYSFINFYNKKINPSILIYQSWGYLFDLLFFGSSLVLLFNLVDLLF